MESSALVNAINASGYNSSLLTPTISAPTLSNNSIYIGSSITGSITISGTGATPTGTVTFQESNDGISWTQIGVAKILSSGTATSDSFQPFYGGTFLIKVNYSGDLVYNAVVSSASTLTVSGGGSNLITDTIGSPANESPGWNNYIYSSNITASGNGLLHSIGIFVNGPIGNARVALYSSSAGGVLSGLLAQSASTAITVANTFQDIACTGSTLVAGHTYYIAFQLDNALTGLWGQVKGTLNYAPYSYGSFPDPTGTYSPEIFSINMRMTYGSLIPTFVLSLSQISISLGQSITASITVSGTGTTPTGFITFQESNDNGQTWIQLGTVKSLIGGSTTSDSFTPTYSQNYLIKAIYSGDNYYAPGTSGTLVLAVSQYTYTISTPNLSSLFVLAGSTVTITGAVSGSSTAPTGTVNLMISADNGNSWIQYGSTKTLISGSNISTATFDNYNSPNIGTFWFMIDYNGDSNYTWSSGPADALVVTGSHSTTQQTLTILAATI